MATTPAMFAQHAHDIAARDQEKIDQQFLEKHDQLVGQRDALLTKLGTLRDENGNPMAGYDDTFHELQKNQLAIADHWHPARNPGMIERFGDKLTDALKITNPQKRIEKHAQQAEQRWDAAGKEARAQEATLPAPAGPQAAATARSNAAAQLAQMQGAIKNYDETNPHATPEARTKFIQDLQERILLGVTGRNLEERGQWKPVTGTNKATGEKMTLLFDGISGHYRTQNNEEVPDEVLSNFMPDVKSSGAKPSQAQFMVALRAYARDHGVDDVEKLPQSAIDYVTRKLAQDRQNGTSSTVTSFKQDLKGNWVPLTTTNYRNPSKEALVDPLAAQMSKKTPEQIVASTMATPHPKGLVETGNLPIWDRPRVENDDGTYSSEYSFSREQDGKEVLVPTIVNGQFLTPDGKKPQEGSPEEKQMFDRAWQHYLQTGENLGKFDNAQDANAYSQILHNRGTAPQQAPVQHVAQLRGEAQKRAPQGTGPATAAQGHTVGNVHVGPPIMAGRTPEYTKARNDLEAAKKTDNMAKLAMASHEAVQQRNLAIALIRAMAGRVNMNEYTQYTTRMGVPNTIEGMLNGIVNGQLPEGIVQQLANLAHSNLISAQQVIDDMERDQQDGPQPQPGQKPAGATHKTQYSGKWYWTDDEGNNLGEIK